MGYSTALIQARGAAAVESDEPTSFDRRAGVFAIVLVVGYLVAGRTFAYIGVAGANVYIGEIVLVALACHPRSREAFMGALRSIRTGGTLCVPATIVAALLCLGALELLRGLHSGFSVLYALRNLPFDYYPAFVFAGAWVSARNPGLLRRATWWLAVVNAIYGSAFVLVFSHLTLTLPTEPNVALLGTGTGSAFALLGLLSYHRAQRWTPLLAALNVFALLGNQIRAEWIAFVVGLALWAVLSKRVRLVLQGGLAVVVALAVLAAAHVNIAGAGGRGGSVSLGGVFGRLIAAVDPSLASRYVANSSTYSDTVSWRTTWWHAIWKSSNSSPQLRLLGHGYGFPLPSLTTYVPQDTRTPHNVFFYALAYSGWLGVVLMVLLWLSLFQVLLRRGQQSGDWFGLVAFTTAIVIGCFGDWFETPFGAVPSYLLVGLAIGPMLQMSRAAAVVERPWETPRRTASLRAPLAGLKQGKPPRLAGL